jgi:hypothetical protein
MSDGREELPRDERLHAGPQRAFFDCIERRLAPVLQADGFRGSRKCFRRVRGEAVHVIQPQPASSGDRCYINLAVHLLFLPIYDGSLPDPGRISEAACEFRWRLSPGTTAGSSWFYGPSPTETEASVRNAIEAYETVGRGQFDTIGEFSGIYATLQPADLRDQERNPLFGLQMPVRLARSLALAALHLGQRQRARDFAEFGLSNIGTAKALVPVFEAVLRATSDPHTQS